MTTKHPEWVPEIGEIAWIPEETSIPTEFRKEVRDRVTGHFALIVHVTPGEDAKTRYVWFLVLYSTKGYAEREDRHLHFQYKYVSKNGRVVEDHSPTECSPACKSFLFLKPDGNQTATMNMAGYVDIESVLELPLYCLRPRRSPKWHLRDCSFSLIADKARELIADRLACWQPRYETHVLCQKLDVSHLSDNDLLCWVEPASKQLVDSNGTCYPGPGPCVVRKTNSGKAKICVILDNRKPEEMATRFAEIKNDAEIETRTLLATNVGGISYGPKFLITFPEGSSRMRCVSNQLIVLEPTFEVSTDELYLLPPCYLPVGTQVRVLLGCRVDSILSSYSQYLAPCVKRRKARDAEPNRLKALQTAGVVEEARKLEEKLRKAKLQRQKALGDQDHEALSQKITTALQKVKSIAINHLVAPEVGSSRNDHDQLTYETSEFVEMLAVYLLFCAALACLKQEGAVLRADENEVKSPDQVRRSDLAAAIDKVVTGIEKPLPQCHCVTELRKAIGPTVVRCDTAFWVLRLSPFPTWKDFMPEEVQIEQATSADQCQEEFPKEDIAADKLEQPLKTTQDQGTQTLTDKDSSDLEDSSKDILEDPEPIEAIGTHKQGLTDSRASSALARIFSLQPVPVNSGDRNGHDKHILSAKYQRLVAVKQRFNKGHPLQSIVKGSTRFYKTSGLKTSTATTLRRAT